MNYQSIITSEPGKRGGRPCIRRMRIAVADVLGWLAAGMAGNAGQVARAQSDLIGHFTLYRSTNPVT